MMENRKSNTTSSSLRTTDRLSRIFQSKSTIDEKLNQQRVSSSSPKSSELFAASSHDEFFSPSPPSSQRLQQHLTSTSSVKPLAEKQTVQLTSYYEYNKIKNPQVESVLFGNDAMNFPGSSLSELYISNEKLCFDKKFDTNLTSLYKKFHCITKIIIELKLPAILKHEKTYSSNPGRDFIKNARLYLQSPPSSSTNNGDGNGDGKYTRITSFEYNPLIEEIIDSEDSNTYKAHAELFGRVNRDFNNNNNNDKKHMEWFASNQRTLPITLFATELNETNSIPIYKMNTLMNQELHLKLQFNEKKKCIKSISNHVTNDDDGDDDTTTLPDIAFSIWCFGSRYDSRTLALLMNQDNLNTTNDYVFCSKLYYDYVMKQINGLETDVNKSIDILLDKLNGAITELIVVIQPIHENEDDQWIFHNPEDNSFPIESFSLESINKSDEMNVPIIAKQNSIFGRKVYENSIKCIPALTIPFTCREKGSPPKECCYLSDDNQLLLKCYLKASAVGKPWKISVIGSRWIASQWSMKNSLLSYEKII
jgi:hypothetical protein